MKIKPSGLPSEDLLRVDFFSPPEVGPEEAGPDVSVGTAVANFDGQIGLGQNIMGFFS